MSVNTVSGTLLKLSPGFFFASVNSRSVCYTDCHQGSQGIQQQEADVLGGWWRDHRHPHWVREGGPQPGDGAVRGDTAAEGLQGLQGQEAQHRGLLPQCR